MRRCTDPDLSLMPGAVVTLSRGIPSFDPQGSTCAAPIPGGSTVLLLSWPGPPTPKRSRPFVTLAVGGRIAFTHADWIELAGSRRFEP
jgi:hypothetical protein